MRKIFLRLLFYLGISILFFVAYLVYIIDDAKSVSKGVPIDDYKNPSTVLFVIDVQEGITGNYALSDIYKDQAPELINSVNKAITVADLSNVPVAYIYQQTRNWFFNWADDYVLALGSPGVAIDGRIKLVSLNYFPKRKNDAFSNHDLNLFLETLEVNRIIISGLDIAHCAGKTSQAALNRGYEVVVIEDAVISETDELRKEKIIELETAGAQIIQIDQLTKLLAGQ